PALTTLRYFLLGARQSTEPTLPDTPCQSADSASGYCEQMLLSASNWISVLPSTTPTTLKLALASSHFTILVFLTSFAVVLVSSSLWMQSPTLALTVSFLLK